MKKLLLLLLITVSTFAQVGINTTNPQAVLDITSTTSGVLIPRLTTDQKIAISNPATSMLVFDSNLNVFNYYNGISWIGLNQSKNYSFEELNTGDINFDGKPIYRKSIKSFELSNIFNINNLKDVVFIDAYFKTTSFYIKMIDWSINTQIDANTCFGRFEINTQYSELGTEVYIGNLSNEIYQYTFITIEYTKTTD